MSYPNENLANLGLLIESVWPLIHDHYQNNNPPGADILLTQFDDLLVDANGQPLKIVDYEKIANAEGQDVLKCIALEDSEGNIIVHFRGTGDGNWDYNKAAYDKYPSLIQTESAEFLERVLKDIDNQIKSGERSEAPSVYLTGHSQGGNTAQYAGLAVSEEYGKYVTRIISLDGPGFSRAVVEQLKGQGDDYFEQQRQKIYSYNGNNDYVHVLGQEELVPKDHKYMIKTANDPYVVEGYVEGPEGLFINAHCANFMLNPDGSMREYLPYDEAIEQGWRGELQSAVLALNKVLANTLPDDVQVAIATLVMAIVEQITNGDDPNAVNGDFDAVLLAIIAAIPGGDAILASIEAHLQKKGITNRDELWAYFSADPLTAVWDLISHLLQDPNALLALVNMGASIYLLTILVPIFVSIMKIVIPIAAVIVLGAFVVSLIVEFLVQVWDTLVNTAQLVAEYVTQLAKDIYNHVCEKIDMMIDEAIETMKLLQTKAKDLAKKVYATSVAIVTYAKERIKDALNMAQTIADKVAQAVTGAVQNAISIQVERLDACVRDMLSIANRVQYMDDRLDRLYYRLLNDMVEKEEGFFISLLNLYNLTKADIKVDQGGMIRRMANNINSWNNAYKEVENWLLAVL